MGQRTEAMLEALRGERVETWFDLGLVLDRLREDREIPAFVAPVDFDAFALDLEEGAGIVTFDIGVDGVTIEIAKYAEALEAVLPGVRLHYIAGRFDPAAAHLVGTDAEWHCVPEIDGFEAWPLYRDFFRRRLERGSASYNDLIGRCWDATLHLCEALGELVESRDLRLLYLVNVSSNPGNPALALALALVSEHLGVPVVNNCHDFYFEGGHSDIEREALGLPRAARDHFFKNAHLGEVFSIIELLYPWESRSWVQLCINAAQVDTLCSRVGCNPGSVSQVGTAIDGRRFRAIDRARVKETWSQVAALLQGRDGRVPAQAAREALDKGRLEPDPRRPMLLAGKKQKQVDFTSHNTILLQPTRILSRKRIEVSFKLIRRLFRDDAFADAFRGDKTKKLTLLVSGPVAKGHDAYLTKIVRDFDKLIDGLDAAWRDRVYLGFLFSGFDAPDFREAHDDAIGMPELYNLASLVVLPSETEGRGLPIVEASACGTPVVTRRYEPVEVFREVVGEGLAREDRLDLHVFENDRFHDVMLERVSAALLHPDHHSESAQHNRRVVERRFSMPVLERDIAVALRRLHLQLADPGRFEARATQAFVEFGDRVAVEEPALESLLQTEHREYLPGYGRMGLMLMLKSLIDPSYFRVEEQRLRGMAFDYARRLEAARATRGPIRLDEQLEFYDSVEALFLARAGEMPVRIDHSLAYRHRNRRRYAYREFTPQELTGVITLLHREMFGSASAPAVAPLINHQVAGWHRMVARCTGGEPELDDRDRLLARLGENRSFALFPGERVEHEIEVFVLQAVRRRLGLSQHDELTDDDLDAGPELAPIALIVRREAVPGEVDAAAVSKHLAEQPDSELGLLCRRDVCRLVDSDQISLGIDFRQLGARALRALVEIRDSGGFLVAACEQAAMTTDGAVIERFHIGRADDPLTANILGVPDGAGYVSWVPAGLRATLAYPTPVQTAHSLSQIWKSSRYRRLCKRIGEDKVLETLRDDALVRGSKVEDVLASLSAPSRSRSGPVDHEAINGVYEDGCPWSGVIARVEKPLRYTVLSTRGENQVVPEFVRRFNRTPGRRARIAWNGGYILNAELVGKLGLPESYIGSPLGLIVGKGKVLCPPLFEKPALLVAEGGALEIRRVSCAQGLVAKAGRNRVDLGPADRNSSRPGDRPCFYDLLYPGEALPGDGRTIVRTVGNRIMEVVETRPGEAVPVLPVGLVFSFPRGGLPADWAEGKPLTLEIVGLEGVSEAVEAGPLLLDGGEVAIDMEREGWKTRTSIQTQAARLDYLDMRGPKIAVGLDAEGALTVLAVNGRIRESTGATHIDMAEILKSRGLRTAMGFDPGGSATLVVGDEVLNISPYNPDYERNVYALPPEPRGVANAVIGW